MSFNTENSSMFGEPTYWPGVEHLPSHGQTECLNTHTHQNRGLHHVVIILAN